MYLMIEVGPRISPSFLESSLYDMYIYLATRHVHSPLTSFSYPHCLPALSLQTNDSDTTFLKTIYLPISCVHLSSIHF